MSLGLIRFKLHMRPRGQRSNMLSPTIPPLPPNKAVVEVFSDFLRYLHKCARLYIQETHANGTSLWNSISSKISYVLTHPNGWEGPQQAQMREAAIRAGLISDNVEGRSRVSFVPEGEASLHFCINNQLAPNALEVSVCDPFCLIHSESFLIPLERRRDRDCGRWWGYN
jgi:hypothetical protein